MAFNISLKDFEPDVFVLNDYVEKLSKVDPSTGLMPTSASERNKPFDPVSLLNTFKESIEALKEMSNRNQRRVEKLEQVCSQQEREHEARIRELDRLYTEAFGNFQELEDRITYVATKVVHLGDQLESSNNRRARDFEAEMLMQYLAEFYTTSKPTSRVFTDPGQLPEAADIIFKLNMLAQELPLDKYREVKIRISEKYVEIEKSLVDKFKESHVSADIPRMKRFASALQQFSLGYTKCVESFILVSLQKSVSSQATSTDHIYLDVEKHCAKVRDQIDVVFESPEMVTTRFIQAIFEKVLSKHIMSTLDKLTEEKKTSEYLTQLHELYTRTTRLANKLSRPDMTSDPAFLSKLTKVTLFNKYLTYYSTGEPLSLHRAEVDHLQKRCNNMLTRYYESLEIPKRSHGGLRARLFKASPDELYISEDVCASVIYESKQAVGRCKELITDRELSDTVTQIYLKVLELLCTEHFEYALDIVFASKHMLSFPNYIEFKVKEVPDPDGIPSSQPSSAPSGQFFRVIGVINSQMPLIESLFREKISPCIKYPQIASTCLETKRKVITNIEHKVEQGIVRCLNSMLNWVKRLLSAQQKLDFKPEDIKADEGIAAANSTNACRDVVQYVCECYRVIHDSLDGKNREAVLMEFGTRLHRAIYEHVQQFTFNSTGGMLAICDMNAYRKAVQLFENKLLDQLFENLQSLCNIFIIAPENIKQVCSEEPLVGFDRAVLMTMVQLRADYKKTKQFTL